METVKSKTLRRQTQRRSADQSKWLVAASLFHIDTIQLYSVDRSGNDAHSKQINYKDSKIGLKLPIPISEISDYDLSAPFVSESGEEIGEEDPHFYKALDMRKFR